MFIQLLIIINYNCHHCHLFIRGWIVFSLTYLYTICIWSSIINYNCHLCHLFLRGWTVSSFTTPASSSVGSPWHSATISKWVCNSHNLLHNHHLNDHNHQWFIMITFSQRRQRYLVTIVQTCLPWMKSSMQQLLQASPTEIMICWWFLDDDDMMILCMMRWW